MTLTGSINWFRNLLPVTCQDFRSGFLFLFIKPMILPGILWMGFYEKEKKIRDFIPLWPELQIISWRASFDILTARQHEIMSRPSDVYNLIRKR